MNDIELKFSNLSHEQALEMIAAHATIKAGGRFEPLGNGGETAPTATPSTGNTTATADQDTDDTNGDAPMLDKRGVPFHGDFHYPRHKEDGSWVLRRNHDKTAREAYEAGYLQPGKQITATAENAQSSDAAGAATPTMQSAPSTAYEPAAPSATFEAPAVRYLPSVAEYEAKWAQLCRELKVTGEHQAFIEHTFGGHPCNPVVRDVEENRRQIWVVFLRWEQGVKGF